MLILPGATSACGTAVGIAVAPVIVAVAPIRPGVPSVKDVGVGEVVGVSVGVVVGLGVNVAVGSGNGNGVGVAVGVGGIGDGGTGVNVAVGGAAVGVGEAVGSKRVGAKVGNVRADRGFPLKTMMPNSPPTAMIIRAGAIHLSRVMLFPLLRPASPVILPRPEYSASVSS
jgi:hypothetical protein